jgi:hypothetical protein
VVNPGTSLLDHLQVGVTQGLAGMVGANGQHLDFRRVTRVCADADIGLRVIAEQFAAQLVILHPVGMLDID